MCYILQIETATTICSVALAKDGKTVHVLELDEPNIHASKLTVLIQQLLTDAQVQMNDLSAIAISKGPGSYTGLRIGVSVAKGICFALDKPLIAMDTLKMMAAGYLYQNPNYTGLLCPMIDARRMEVYTALFDEKLKVVQEVSASIIDEHSFAVELQGQAILFGGNGAEKCRSVIHHANADFVDINLNSAQYMSELAYQAFINQDFVDLAYFEPFYLKDFVLTPSNKKLI